MVDYETLETNGDIKLCKIDGKPVYLVAGLAFENGQQTVEQYGLLQSDLGKYAERGQLHAIGQFISLVGNGLICTRHIFNGLNRPLCDDGSMYADQDKFIHSRKPKWDYKWIDTVEPRQIPAPTGKVFVVIISKNIKHLDRFPMIYGWIDWWNWVDEDKGLAEAPINWVDRFVKKIYSRP